MSSDEIASSSSQEVPIIMTSNSSNRKMDFSELKKQLKGIEKLSKNNLDTRSWRSELNLWIKFQHITDPETIYTACILTSIGQTREIIEELANGNHCDDDDLDDDESENEETKFPSLDEVVDAVEVFYGLKEDQHVLLRDIRALRIKKNERVKDFNIRYRSLYLKLDKKRKKQISVLDYADSLQNNREAWKKVSMKDDISLSKAFKIAEKVDRLSSRSEYDNYESTSYHSQNRYNKTFQPPYKKRYDNNESPKVKKEEMEDLTKKMKNLSIHTCYFCLKKGHKESNCPAYQEIIANNRKEILQQGSLNQ